MMSSVEGRGSRLQSTGKLTARRFFGFEGLEVYPLAKTLVLCQVMLDGLSLRFMNKLTPWTQSARKTILQHNDLLLVDDLLILDTKPLLAALPNEESFAPSGQLRHASSSVVLNVVLSIAEGKGRGSDGDFVRYLYQARGSQLEAVTTLGLAKNCGYLPRSQTQTFFDAAFILNAKLTAFIRSLAGFQFGPKP